MNAADVPFCPSAICVELIRNAWTTRGCKRACAFYGVISTPLAQVTNMARQMVINYGFSDIGPWSLLDQNAQSGDMIMRMMARSGVSESLQQKIDVAVRKIADEAYTTALRHIRDNREVRCEARPVLVVDTVPAILPPGSANPSPFPLPLCKISLNSMLSAAWHRLRSHLVHYLLSHACTAQAH